jgi:hypothetical protein
MTSRAGGGCCDIVVDGDAEGAADTVGTFS